jgi:hypothetical protein
VHGRTATSRRATSRPAPSLRRASVHAPPRAFPMQSLHPEVHAHRGGPCQRPGTSRRHTSSLPGAVRWLSGRPRALPALPLPISPWSTSRRTPIRSPCSSRGARGRRLGLARRPPTRRPHRRGELWAWPAAAQTERVPNLPCLYHSSPSHSPNKPSCSLTGNGRRRGHLPGPPACPPSRLLLAPTEPMNRALATPGPSPPVPGRPRPAVGRNLAGPPLPDRQGLHCKTAKLSRVLLAKG